jgi:hypothetical protein
LIVSKMDIFDIGLIPILPVVKGAVTRLRPENLQ